MWYVISVPLMNKRKKIGKIDDGMNIDKNVTYKNSL